MKVIIAAAIDPFKHKPGGIRNYIVNLIKYINDCNTSVTLIGVNTNGCFADKHFDFIKVMRGKKSSGTMFLLMLMLKAPFFKFQKQSLIHTHRPDIMLPFIVYNKNNKKICTLHGFHDKGIILKKGKIFGTIYTLIEKYTLKRVDKVIAVDNSTKEFYTKKYPWLKEKIVEIPIGINLDKFKIMDKKVVRAKYGFGIADTIILYVGRLEAEKNIDFLLKSFKSLKCNGHKAKLLLVGDGRERTRLENLSKHLNLDQSVIFMGSMNTDIIPEIMNCADVFTLSSLYESGPIVIQEALACGIPVVTTNVGRVHEFLLNNDVGRIVQRDSDKFAEAIEEMINSDQKISRQACFDVARRFDFAKTAEKTMNIYEELWNKF